MLWLGMRLYGYYQTGAGCSIVLVMTTSKSTVAVCLGCLTLVYNSAADGIVQCPSALLGYVLTTADT